MSLILIVAMGFGISLPACAEYASTEEDASGLPDRRVGGGTRVSD